MHTHTHKLLWRLNRFICWEMLLIVLVTAFARKSVPDRQCSINTQKGKDMWHCTERQNNQSQMYMQTSHHSKSKSKSRRQQTFQQGISFLVASAFDHSFTGCVWREARVAILFQLFFCHQVLCQLLVQFSFCWKQGIMLNQPLHPHWFKRLRAHVSLKIACSFYSFISNRFHSETCTEWHLHEISVFQHFQHKQPTHLSKKKFNICMCVWVCACVCVCMHMHACVCDWERERLNTWCFWFISNHVSFRVVKIYF